MTAKPFLALAALLALPAVFFLGRCSAPGEHDAHDHGTTTTAVTSSAPEVWTCSMHPQVRQPQFGTCPICAMDLIPLANDDDANDDGELPRLRLTERAVALMAIRTAPVRAAEARAELRLPGRLAPDESRLLDVAARFPGRIEKLPVAYTGASFRAGDPLLELYSPELLAAQEEFRQAARLRATQPALADLAADKLRLLGLTDAQLDSLAAAPTAPDTLAVLAPFDGVVLQRRVTTGQYVATGDPLFTAADLSVLWAQLEAYEADLALLRPGDEVALTVEARPGETFPGTVAFIDPVLDETKRTARVRIEISNTDHRLRPGLLATGLVQSRYRPDDRDPLIIPATAPLFTGKRSVVYVRVPDPERPVFEARTVTLGPRLGDVYPVLDGLAEGDLVVVHGQFKLDSELQIRGRPSMMSAAATDTAVAGAPVLDPRDAPAPTALSAAVPDDFAAELVPLIDAYLDLAEHLAAEDEAKSRAAHAALLATLDRIGEHRLGGDAHVAWMTHYTALRAPLVAVPAPASLDALRAQLQALTLAVEATHVTFGQGRLPPVLRAHCPMVEGGAKIGHEEIGTWLQRTQPLANPYWGSVMLRCGDFHGELN